MIINSISEHFNRQFILYVNFFVMIGVLSSPIPVNAGGTFSVTNSTITLPDSLTIPDNTPAGTVVWTSESTATELTVPDSGTRASKFAAEFGSGSPQSSGYGSQVYETGVPGLGFRLVGLFQTPSTSGITQYFCTTCLNSASSYTWNDASASKTQQAKLELIVTGTVGTGTTNLTGIQGRLRYYWTDRNDSRQEWLISLTNTTIIASSCTIGSYDSTVDLGTTYTQNFKRVGSTSSPVGFSVGVRCNSTELSPSITFKGTADKNNSTVFANTVSDKSEATGVGVQLLYNDTAILPGEKVSLGSVTNTSENVYAFSARMYQTLNPVGAGNFSAPVIITIDYSKI